MWASKVSTHNVRQRFSFERGQRSVTTSLKKSDGTQAFCKLLLMYQSPSMKLALSFAGLIRRASCRSIKAWRLHQSS